MLRRKIRSQRAFTVIELIVVVAIAVVVLSLAAPSFKDMIDMQRLRGTHDQIVTDLQFARAESARLGVPVHFYVKQASLSAAACYIIFSDSTRRVQDWGTPCDCHAAAGSRCTTAVTAEIRTVQMQETNRIALISGASGARVAYDPVTGGIMMPVLDEEGAVPLPFVVDSHMDTPRTLRAVVELSGRPATCAPSGSTIRVAAC